MELPGQGGEDKIIKALQEIIFRAGRKWGAQIIGIINSFKLKLYSSETEQLYLKNTDRKTNLLYQGRILLFSDSYVNYMQTCSQ